MTTIHILPVAKVTSAYSGDPDTKGTKRVELVADINHLPIGTLLCPVSEDTVTITKSEYNRLLAAL